MNFPTPKLPDDYNPAPEGQFGDDSAQSEGTPPPAEETTT